MLSWRARPRAAAAASQSRPLLGDQAMVSSPGTFVPIAKILGSCCGEGALQVSGKKTIFASSPLAAWMVMTRTAPELVSMSRLTEYSKPATSLRKLASDGAEPVSCVRARFKNHQAHRLPRARALPKDRGVRHPRREEPHKKRKARRPRAPAMIQACGLL